MKPIHCRSAPRFLVITISVALFSWLATAKAQFSYVITPGGVAVITGYSGPGGDVIIPSYASAYRVVEIGEWAFQGNGTIVSISIPDGVTNIAEAAFFECTNLVSVELPSTLLRIERWAFADCPIYSLSLPSNLTSIGDRTFNVCNNLGTVTIPGSVTNLGVGIFETCLSLTDIEVDPSNPAYASAEGVLFDKNLTTLLQYPYARMGDYVVPSEVETIRDSAFVACTNLTGITLSPGLREIQDYAFWACSSLSELQFPFTLTNIGAGAIQDCFGLTNIFVPASVLSIGVGAFEYCPLAPSIDVDGSNPNYRSIDGILFNRAGTELLQCPISKTGLYSLPATVITIDPEAFWASELLNIVLPEGLQDIGNNAFTACEGFTSIVIPSTLTNLGGGSFSQCVNLTNIYFRGNAPTVGDGAFLGDTSVTVYYLPGKLGWEQNWGGVQTDLWLPQISTDPRTLGLSNNAFGFQIEWARGMTAIVESSVAPTGSSWLPLVTNLMSFDTWDFIDPAWTNFPKRLYRVRLGP